MPKIVLRSRSKVKVKLLVAVDIRGSALLSATKSNTSHNQSEVIVCNQGHIRIIARMKSIDF